MAAILPLLSHNMVLSTFFGLRAVRSTACLSRSYNLSLILTLLFFKLTCCACKLAIASFLNRLFQPSNQMERSLGNLLMAASDITSKSPFCEACQCFANFLYSVKRCFDSLDGNTNKGLWSPNPCDNADGISRLSSLRKTSNWGSTSTRNGLASTLMEKLCFLALMLTVVIFAGLLPCK